MQAYDNDVADDAVLCVLAEEAFARSRAAFAALTATLAGAEAGGWTHDQLEEQLETRRLVDRAKGILMDGHGMAEAAAFSFIQRNAMRQRVTMRVVASQVVDGSLRPGA